MVIYQNIIRKIRICTKRNQNIVLCPILNKELTASSCSGLNYWSKCPKCKLKNGKKARLTECQHCNNKCEQFYEKMNNDSSFTEVMDKFWRFLSPFSRLSKINVTRDLEDELNQIQQRIKQCYIDLDDIYFKTPIELRVKKKMDQEINKKPIDEVRIANHLDLNKNSTKKTEEILKELPFERKYSFAEVMVLFNQFYIPLMKLDKDNVTRDLEGELNQIQQRIKQCHIDLDKLFFRTPKEWREAK